MKCTSFTDVWFGVLIVFFITWISQGDPDIYELSQEYVKQFFIERSK